MSAHDGIRRNPEKVPGLAAMMAIDDPRPAAVAQPLAVIASEDFHCPGQASWYGGRSGQRSPMNMNEVERAADTRTTPGESMPNLIVARPAEFSVPQGQKGNYEEVDRLRREVRELRAQVLHAVAVAMTAAIWFVVPVAGLSGMYYMTGSTIGPLCLAVLVALTGAMNYLLVNWMLIAWSEADLEHPSVAVTDNLPHQSRQNAVQPETEVQAQASPHKSPSRS